jgi:cellulose synthase/poly-beta-1,6-N-acetylglucosamine synthase-like glycosyltransferase
LRQEFGHAALTPGERWLARADAFVFSIYHALRLGIAWVFLLGIALVSGRALIIGVLAVIEKMLPDQPGPTGFEPPVTVIIPAYDEEEVIVETVRSALDSTYPNFDVIVVNDGSKDSTGAKLEENFGREARLRILHQANQGKPAALNRALEEAGGEIVVTIDADTSIAPEAISKLVRHFVDPRVAAVAGNTKVANRNRWLTRWQALEYVTSQNLEKRAFHLLNCITVVPGAIGAWRAEALHALGGFPYDTVAEDTDLTLAMRRRGGRVLYDEEAIARTHAPETAAELLRQRFRWTFGTLQAVWKHRDTLGRLSHGTLGWVAMPNIFLFQIVLPLLSPVIDLLFVGSLVLWGLARLHVGRVPQLWTGEDVERAFLFFGAFMLIDFLTCVIAFTLEKREDWSLLLPLLLQRFYYRQMMYVVLFHAIARAVQGRAVGWGGVEPRATTPAGV